MVESVRVPKKCYSKYQKGVEPVWVSENGRIRANTEKSLNYAENREMVESVRVPENYLSEYRKRVESLCVSENGTMRANTEKS